MAMENSVIYKHQNTQKNGENRREGQTIYSLE
jgi:hypothetical protein